MSTVVRASLLGIVLFALGCASVDTGNQQLQKDRVAQIQKGVTTRAQVEQMFGPPSHVQMMDDGRRTMIYMGMHEDINNGAGTMQWAIPVIGPFLPGGTNTNTRRIQRLQIILNKEEVVEDYEFSDTTTESQSSNSVTGGYHGTETTTENK